jgi:hypothetical protein
MRCDSDRCWIATGGHGRGVTGTVLLPEAANLVRSLGAGTLPAKWREGLRDAAKKRIPYFSDARASGEYRRAVTTALLERLVEAWLARRGGGR